MGRQQGERPGSEPYSGNPTVRDRRGARGNVSMVKVYEDRNVVPREIHLKNPTVSIGDWRGSRLRRSCLKSLTSSVLRAPRLYPDPFQGKLAASRIRILVKAEDMGNGQDKLAGDDFILVNSYKEQSFAN